LAGIDLQVRGWQINRNRSHGFGTMAGVHSCSICEVSIPRMALILAGEGNT